MAVVFIDGFDHYGTAANMITYGKWQAVSDGTITSGGRTGSRFNVNGGPVYVLLPTEYNRIITGHGVRMNDTVDFTAIAIWQVRDLNAVAQVSITIGASNQLEIRRGDHTGTIIATTAIGTVYLSNWFYIEVDVKIGDSDGHVKIRINNELVYDQSNIDTRLGTDMIAQFVIQGRTSGFFTTSVDYDDLIIIDPSVGPQTDWPGDVRVYNIRPNAPGVSSDFTPVGATPNWAAVDDTSPDGDGTYVQSQTIGHVDSYQLESMPGGATGVVRAVALVNLVRKTDSGTAQFRARLRSGTSPNTVANGATHTIATTYLYYQDIFHTDPVSGSPFTITEINSIQAQIEVMA